MNEREKATNELKEQVIKRDDLLKSIKRITDTLTDDEVSLVDIVAFEEQLKNRCDELTDTMSNIIQIRQWLDMIDFSQF